ncbi:MULTISPECIES: hypothetical protein [Saccharothrix]|uniref:hypothetical protein n=1 Tax=Saccharothrix TaxID=2071 RepID=UPI00093B8EBA|nr:hypothetical protein [Saccharothrix sp. CB00851]OKI18334.1 hypothetical protein A6A25_12350 [Saccharothrix sp. CB00851]
MAYVSVLADSVRTLLQARGWRCDATRFTIRAVEPTLDNIKHVWMAGEAIALTDTEITQVRPTRVLVPDLTPAKEVERIEEAMRAAAREPRVNRITHFIDILWDASTAAVRARRDAETADNFEGFVAPDLTVPDRHVKQHLKLGGERVSDNRLLERGLSASGSALAILADAGLGKSELLKWHEWRHAVQYESAVAQRAHTYPSVALRVPLRGLRTLSLDAISHYLSRPSDEDHLPALNRLDSGRFLLELLRRQRLILLLDGTDELMISRAKLEEGLRELRRAVGDGARLAVSSRLGHLNSTRTIGTIFDSGEIATIEPMEPAGGRELLLKNGADPARADEVLKALQSSKAQGIPLFLLLAYYVNLKDELDVAVASSRTNVLLALLELLCVRDEERLGIDSKEQMAVLTDFAHWTHLLGDLNEHSALEHLGIDVAESKAAMILNPHALLTRTADGMVVFKYTEFLLLFAAKAISEDWRHLGFDSVAGDLRGTKLDDMTVEYLARLLSSDDIARGWSRANGEYPLLKRNVLAIALARVEDECPGEVPAVRSACLARLLGGKSLCDTLLADVVIQRLDLQGWTLRRLSGSGSLTYCVNAKQCDYDESVLQLNTEGTEFPKATDDAARLARGCARLDAMIKPLKRRSADGLVRMISLEECTDQRGWSELRRVGAAEQERKFGGGERFWVLTESGVRMLTRYAFREDDNALPGLMSAEPDLRVLLLALGNR